MKMMTA